ncbi:MAG: HNH endonuclease [Clostridia bacterium]|nr:HNH endonuclease [Clostridia bacterium]
MKTLSKPLLNTKAEDIFEECVNGYRDAQKKNKLLSCKNLIATDSASFDNTIPHNANNFSQSTLPDEVSNKEVYSVYDDKFARQGSPGRHYYDTIKSQPPRGVCPICGIRIVNTLDHYLPKSEVPTLSITPNNLIPSCRDCNMDKRANISFVPSEMPVHLYFDEIPNEPWLYVKIKDNFETLYYVSCPESWEVGLRNRMKNHLDIYNLHSLYSSHAAQEIADNMMRWENLVNQAGIDELKIHIERECKSIESNDINSWRAALYRALVSDFDKLKDYLQSI